jgi:hypothetical protein
VGLVFEMKKVQFGYFWVMLLVSEVQFWFDFLFLAFNWLMNFIRALDEFNRSVFG